MMISETLSESTSTAPQSVPDHLSGRPARRPRRTPYPHLFRMLHWLLPASLVVAVLTGLSLHAVARPGWSLFSGVLPWWFWEGRVHVFHLSAAIVFLPSLLAMLWLYWRRKVRRRVTHVTLLGGGLVMIFTGLVLLNPAGPSAIYWIARVLHAVSGLAVLPVALAWHVVDGLGRFRRALVPAFRPWASPRWRQLLCFLPIPLVTACLIVNVLPAPLARRELVAKRVSPAKGNFEALSWDEASPLVIELAGGVGFDKGRTRVALRALHDGEDLFVRAEWFDPTEDRRYMPWKKADHGWQRLLTDENDESYYYEDKFSLVFPARGDWKFETYGCAIYCHAGGGRAYGYKGSDYIVDVWHWKSTRVDPVGQVDDKHWAEVDFSAKNVGRHGDPKTGGGYAKNVSEDCSHPAYLPADPLAVKQGVILEDQAVRYSPEAAQTIRTGTIVPGIVLSAFQGDRGDVHCRSQYEDGRWELLIRRKLDTGSPYDVKFVPGQSHAFGCAAFDHSSKRHAYGLAVHRLTLEP